MARGSIWTSYIGPRFSTADVQINVMEEIFFKFLFNFFLAGREGISSRVSQPEGVYFYERATEYLATACLPLDQGVIQGVWGGCEEVRRCGGGAGKEFH